MKILAILAAVAIAALVGCGGGEPPSPTPTPEVRKWNPPADATSADIDAALWACLSHRFEAVVGRTEFADMRESGEYDDWYEGVVAALLATRWDASGREQWLAAGVLADCWASPR